MSISSGIKQKRPGHVALLLQRTLRWPLACPPSGPSPQANWRLPWKAEGWNRSMYLVQSALCVWQAAVKAKVEPPTAAVPFGGEARKVRFAAPRHSTHTNSWEHNSMLR